MKSTLLRAILAAIGTIATAHATPVELNDWTETGRVGNNTFNANGTAGFTELFGGPYTRPVEGDIVHDTGAGADFVTPVTLNETDNTLELSFTVGNILATGPGSNNAFRVGFTNNDESTDFDAVLHYVFGYGVPGNRRDSRFAGNSNTGNEYAHGTSFDSLTKGPTAVALATGNTANFTVTLTYLGDAGGGLHNYRATIDWDGEAHASAIFTRNTDTWDRVHVNINSSALNVVGDTYTVSNVQLRLTSVDMSGVQLRNWVETGGDVDNIFAGNGADGFTETFGTDTDTRNDAGARADLMFDVTFNEPFEALELSLTMGNIIATEGANGGFRIGFENDNEGNLWDATVHYAFGYGDVPDVRRDARFAGDSFSSNEYAFGTTFDINSNIGPAAVPLATGKTAKLVVTLTYLGNAGGGLYYYQATINWDGVKHTSGVFTRSTNTWDKVYVLTNSGQVNLPGDTYMVSNAQIRRISSSPDFADWASGLGLEGGPNGDDDGDGLTNFEEYVFGLDPFDPSSLSPVVTPLSSTTGLFQYTRRNPTLFDTGLTYSHQYSTNLESNSWMPFIPDVDPPATDSGSPVETVTVDLPDALLAEPRLFVRILAQ